MSGAVSRKEMDIERMVTWALRDQGLGWVGRERSVEDWSDYGTVIDDDHTGSHPGIGLWSDDDAMQVKMAIEQLAPEARALLVQYGRAGLRPDWVEEGYGSVQQLRDSRGRLRWIWEDPKNRTGEKRPMMGFVGEQRESVDFHRAQYEVWWQGLADIVAPLNNVLATHRATGPDAPRRPWCESVRPVVFGDDGQPAPRSQVEPKISDLPLEGLREMANKPIRERASDWSIPKRAARKQGAR